MPIPSVKPTGVTEIETILGTVTVSVVDCETPPREAAIFVMPAANAFTMPPLFTVATVAADELQVTRVVKSALLPSL
jgi:hypothetical protein